MADIPASLFFNFFIFLFIPFLFALILRKKRLSPIIGYILGGIVLNNFFDGLVSKQIINNFAYFGILLLLFTIGLEIQFEKILILKKFIVLGGLLQIIFSIIIVFSLSLFFRFNFIQSILIGIALSSSSTSLIAKMIQDRGEEHSFLGELALGVLMFQDLAFIPFMIIFSSITARTLDFFEVSRKVIFSLIISFLILYAVYYFGRRLIPLIFDRIARVSRELLNLLIIVFIFFIAYISILFGVPVLVSVFVSGILISQTLEHYHIFSQIRPLRDLLAIVFFVFIGTNMEISQIFPFLPKIILFTFLVIFLKWILIVFIFLILGFNSRVSFYLGIYLFQIDEDGFILLSIAFLHNIFNQPQYLFLVTTIILSLAITPFLINKKEKIYLLLKDQINKRLPFLYKYLKYRVDSNQSPIDVLTIRDHVVICGYGRIGSSVGRALMLANIPFIAIDYNFHTVEKAKRAGVNIIYGDPSDIDILDYAEVENAAVLILALPDMFSQEAVIINAKRLNPGIFIISRIHKEQHHKRIKALGVNSIVQPEFEASLSIIKKIFLIKKLPKEEIIKKIQYFKREKEGI